MIDGGENDMKVLLWHGGENDLKILLWHIYGSWCTFIMVLFLMFAIFSGKVATW